jgi:hypothetical protein
LHGITLNPAVAKPDEKWHKAVALACKLPLTIFPKEVPKKMARFRLSSDDRILSIKFPELVRLEFPPSIRAACSTVMDGNSLRFKVPIP